MVEADMKGLRNGDAEENWRVENGTMSAE